jgi:hypothetical protein
LQAATPTDLGNVTVPARRPGGGFPLSGET